MIPNSLYSLDLEQSLLGAILKNNKPLAELDLQPCHFFHPHHAEIFTEIKRIYLDRGEVSWPEMTTWAAGRSFVRDDDGVGYLRDLREAVALSQDQTIKHQSLELVEMYRKREVYSAAIRLQDSITEKTAAQVVADFVKDIDGQHSSTSVKSASKIREEIIGALQMPVERDSTGLRCLDDGMAGGMYRGYTYGLCGAEKSGKTTLAHTISYNLSINKVPHLYVAMEMGSFQIEQKNLAREKGFNSLVFLEDRSKALSKMAGLSLNDQTYYLDAPSFTLQEILHHVALTIARHNIHGFIMDYWQLVQGQQKGESEEKHLRNVAQGLADFSRKNKVWCLLLAQMNTEGRLFGGNGLRKACDQLYMIEQYPDNDDLKHARWLRMDASRYTMRGDLGSETTPSLFIDSKSGPYFTEWHT